jgi:hypothetical protein
MASTIQPTPIKHIYTIDESEYGQFCDIDDTDIITIPSRIDKYRYQMTTIEESWSADSRDSLDDLYKSHQLSFDKNSDVSNTTQYYICNILVSSILCSGIIVLKYYIM